MPDTGYDLKAALKERAEKMAARVAEGQPIQLKAADDTTSLSAKPRKHEYLCPHCKAVFGKLPRHYKCPRCGVKVRRSV